MKQTRLAHRQGGAILIVTLLFLVILTMLGITAITGTTMEERMAGNTRDSAIALQAAEAALRDARRDISNITVGATGASFGRAVPMDASFFGNSDTPGTCSNHPDERGLCAPATNPDGTPYAKEPGSVMPAVPKHDMRGTPSVEFGAITGALAVGGAASPRAIAVQPRYVIEAFCLRQHGDSIGERYCNFFRITARGYGRNPNSQVTLQETFVSL